MKSNHKKLMEMFPYFLDKSDDSNFSKSQSVSANVFKDILQSVHDVKDSFRLHKRCLIWKEQNVPYDYTINFVANYPYLKKVSCYKNDSLIYMREYSEEADISSFEYSYESTDNYTQNNNSPVIPTDTFKIIVETYDEYIIKKGFPENDELLGNIYDHDESLDEIGALNGIPRKTYKVTDDYAHTEPPYNDQLSEDDYHYMTRMLEYNLRLHNTPLPVLEIWKLYGIFSDMINREEYLLKMFDETRHPFDEETGLVGDWTPMPWEHKDRLCDLTPDLGRFFFVSANTLLPVKNQNVKFNFKYLNSLAEDLTGNHSVTIYLNDSETPLVENYTGSTYIVNSEDIADDEPNVFTFHAYEDTVEYATEEITVNVRGCSTADWYVSTNGNDTNDGKSSSTPFATIDKAISMVNGEENLIVLSSGTYSIDHTINVPVTCTILGCGEVTISNTDSNKFFKVYQNQSLNIQDITLSGSPSSVLVENSNWINNNYSNTPLFVIIREGMLFILTSSSAYVKSGATVTINVSLIDGDGEPIEDAEISLYKVI